MKKYICLILGILSFIATTLLGLRGYILYGYSTGTGLLKANTNMYSSAGAYPYFLIGALVFLIIGVVCFITFNSMLKTSRAGKNEAAQQAANQALFG